MDGLSRPVWESLTSHHAKLSEGNAFARRFRCDVNLFASARDDSPEALEALGALLRDGEIIYVLQVPEIIVPKNLTVLRKAQGVQMVAAPNVSFAPGTGNIVPLDDGDAPEML